MGLLSIEGIVTATAYSTLAAITIVSQKHSPLGVVLKNSHTQIRGLLTHYGDAFTTFGSVLWQNIPVHSFARSHHFSQFGAFTEADGPSK
jgi:hypothetical protein